MKFCYEKDFAGRWKPVVWHVEPPTGGNVIRSEMWTVPIHYITDGGDVNFYQLQIKFPAPEIKN